MVTPAAQPVIIPLADLEVGSSDGLLDNVGGHRAHLPAEQLPLLPGKFLHSLIPSAKIDGRGHVGKETVDEGWSDNFLIGKGFGHNLHAVPRNHCHRFAGGDGTARGAL